MNAPAGRPAIPLIWGMDAVHGNANHDAGRAGGFVRFEWTRGEISASARAAGNTHDITGPYGSLAVMIRF